MAGSDDVDWSAVQAAVGDDTAETLREVLAELRDCLHASRQAAARLQQRVEAESVPPTTTTVTTTTTSSTATAHIVPEIADLHGQLEQLRAQLQQATDADLRNGQDCTALGRQYELVAAELDALKLKRLDFVESQLTAGQKALHAELLQGQSQLETLRRDRDEHLHGVAELTRQRDALTSEAEAARADFDQADQVPPRLAGQSALLRDKLRHFQEELQRHEQLLRARDTEQLADQQAQKELEDATVSLRADYERRKMDIVEVEREIDSLSKDRMLAREEALTLREQKHELDAAIKRVQAETRWAHDMANKQTREKDTLLKGLRRQTNAANAAALTAASLRAQQKEMQAELDRRRREVLVGKERLAEVRKEIDLAMFAYMQHHHVEVEESNTVGRLQARTAVLEDEVAQLSESLTQQHHAVERLSSARELAIHEVGRATAEAKDLDQRLKATDTILHELEKRHQQLQQQSVTLRAEFDVLRQEKSVIVDMIATTGKRNAVCAAKLVQLEKESDTLTVQSAEKYRAHSQAQLEVNRAAAEKDTLRSEANRLFQQYRDRRESVQTSASTMEMLLTKIESYESHLARVRTDYERILAQRNHLAAAIVERNDELCLLYERQTLHSSILAGAETEMRQRDADIAQLQAEARNLTRQKRTLDSTRPRVVACREQVAEMHETLRQTQQTVADLAHKVETPPSLSETSGTTGTTGTSTTQKQSVASHRLLAGSDPSAPELSAKLAAIERALEQKEKQLADRSGQLVQLDQMRLELAEAAAKKETPHLDDQCEALRDAARRLAEVDRKTLSVLAELSMYQAAHVKLEADKARLEADVQSARDQWARGEPPSADIEQEWERLYRNAYRRQHEKEDAVREWRRLCQQIGIADTGGSSAMIKVDAPTLHQRGGTVTFTLANGTKTTATPRPTAYLPQGERDILLLKEQLTSGAAPNVAQAYGNLAPFKAPAPHHKRATTTTVHLRNKH